MTRIDYRKAWAEFFKAEGGETLGHSSISEIDACCHTKGAANMRLQ